jgi:hypothetical protein
MCTPPDANVVDAAWATGSKVTPVDPHPVRAAATAPAPASAASTHRKRVCFRVTVIIRVTFMRISLIFALGLDRQKRPIMGSASGSMLGALGAAAG